VRWSGWPATAGTSVSSRRLSSCSTPCAVAWNGSPWNATDQIIRRTFPDAGPGNAAVFADGYNSVVAPRNAVHRAFDAFGKSRFREKRSGTWRRDVGAVEQSVNLQKSQYSLRYYLNVELAFTTEMGTGRVVGRAEGLLSPADASQLEALLDVERTKMEEEHREHQLIEVLDRLAALLDELSSVQAMAAHDRQGMFDSMGVTAPARDTFDHWP
jgi:hypothetical protein